MSTSGMNDAAAKGSRGFWSRGKWEGLAIFFLALLAAYFLKTSWRKWPDPIVDFGQQCYCTWRISQGAALGHDFVWNYGPWPVCLNACLFRFLGAGIMVMVAANLLVYAGIVVLAYVAFRRAWGWSGAFAALGVFISVFSFSHFLAVGNYNYVTPYSAEATHGMLLILVTAFVAARWCGEPSRKLALALGFCGGMSVVIKPEFMLATGAVGVAAYALRWAQRKKVTAAEHGSLLAGLVLTTVAFTLWFARTESWRAAFIDASNAWWLVVVEQIQRGSTQQQNFSGFAHPLANALAEVKATFGAFALMALVWLAGWFVNRGWSSLLRTIAALAAGALAFFICRKILWMDAGRCLPGMLLMVFVLLLARIAGELRKDGRVTRGTVMALFLVLLGGMMMARMILFPHIYHLGFFQAALAAMVVAAMMVSELPRWTGPGGKGKCVAMGVAFAVLSFGCTKIAMKSLRIRAEQTQAVSSGRDGFYCTTQEIDRMGVLVDWAAKQMQAAPPQATLLVLPDGLMINYLSRHKSLEPGWGRNTAEQPCLEAIRRNPPDVVIVLTRDLSEFGIARFGAEGNWGRDIMNWVGENYEVVSRAGGDPLDPKDLQGARILQRKAH